LLGLCLLFAVIVIRSEFIKAFLEVAPNTSNISVPVTLIFDLYVYDIDFQI